MINGIDFELELIGSEKGKLSKRLLRERRISDRTCKKFGIVPSFNGWVYPVPQSSVSKRMKSYFSDNGYKYRWIPNKVGEIEFYYHSSLSQSVSEKSGECWFVSGEADVWAMDSANIPNVFSGFTESSVSAKLEQFLLENGVTKLFLAPDLDNTGSNWAKKVVKALDQTSIEVVVYELPSSLGEKADLGKSWANFTELNPFEDFLHTLSVRCIELDENTQIEKYIPPRVFTEEDDIPLGYKEMIFSYFECKYFNEDGFSEPIRCPFHHDEHPSASLHYQKGLWCFTDSTMYRWTDIGKEIGIGSLYEFRLQKAIDSGDYPIQLGHDCRIHMIKNGLSGYARLLDALYLAGLKPGEFFTSSEAERLITPFGISKNTILRLLFHSEKYQNEKQPDLLQNFPLFSLSCRENNPTNKLKVGRKAKEFQLPHPKDISNYFELKFDIQFEQFPIDCFTSIKLYRAQVYHEFLSQHPGKYARKRLGEKIGVSGRTTMKYDKLVDINVEPDIVREQYFVSDIELLPSERHTMPFWKWLEDEDGKRYPPVRKVALKMLNAGKQVFFTTQHANFYSVKKEDNS